MCVPVTVYCGLYMVNMRACAVEWAKQNHEFMRCKQITHFFYFTFYYYLWIVFFLHLFALSNLLPTFSLSNFVSSVYCACLKFSQITFLSCISPTFNLNLCYFHTFYLHFISNDSLCISYTHHMHFKCSIMSKTY